MKQGDDHTGVCVKAGVGGELFEEGYGLRRP